LFAVLAVWVAAKAIVGVGTALLAWRDARADAGQTGSTAGSAAQDAANAVDGARAGGIANPSGAMHFVATVAVTNLVSLLNYRATLFIVEREAGLAATGVYSVAVQVAELLWLLSSAVTVSAYHRIGAPDSVTAARTTLAAVRFNLMATLLSAPLLYLGAAFAVPVWLGEAYVPALLPLALLLPGVAAYAAASSLSAYYTNHRGRPQWSAMIAGLSLGLTLAIALVAVPRHGAAGAAAATSLAYAIAIVFALRSFLRDAGLPWRSLLERRPQGAGSQ
jgi:O-antigen/teichoic acid export membrane protein